LENRSNGAKQFFHPKFCCFYFFALDFLKKVGFDTEALSGRNRSCGGGCCLVGLLGLAVDHKKLIHLPLQMPETSKKHGRRGKKRNIFLMGK